MKYITVQEYATLKQISKQAVYSQISKGKLDFILEDGVKLIEVPDTEITTTMQENSINYQELFKENQRNNKQLVKSLNKQIKRLLKEVEWHKNKYHEAMILMYSKLEDTQHTKSKSKTQNKKKKPKKK